MADPRNDPDTRVLLGEVKLGLDTEQFLRTDVGKLLYRRAQSDSQAGIERLLQADPTDEKEIRLAQNQARLAERFIEWLEDAIVSGRNAEEQLTQQQDVEEQ